MPSVLNVDTIADAAGTGAVALTKQSAAKAWVDFEANGTVSIRDSFNHSSVTDNTTGDYDINFTNAFGSENRSDVIACNYGRNTAIAYIGCLAETPTTTASTLYTFYSLNGTKTDILGDVMVTSNGDLA